MVEKIFESLKKSAENNRKILPRLEDFPISEHTILAAYAQTHTITLIGLPTASLIMQGFLMEMFVKYLYFHHKKQEFEGKLKKLIKICYDEKLFSKDTALNNQYYDFFDSFRDMIRNVQTHFLSKKQTKGMGVRGLKIEIPKNPDGSINAQEFKKVVQEAKENFAEKSKTMWTEEYPFVANALKFELDEDIYLKQFCELDKVIKMLNTEHNLDYKQKV